MVSKKKLELDNSEEDEFQTKSTDNILKINKQYADRYGAWRNKEELQKRKKNKKS